jgi:Glycosyltransferase Family 4
MSLRILITNHVLAGRSGTEMYVIDVAQRLLALGHRPIVYSPVLGALAETLASKTIGVVNELSAIRCEPDVIHAQHSLPALHALLHFPATPAIYVCHDWNWPFDMPPKLPRIQQYVAVDETVRDRLVVVEGIDEQRVEVIYNGVDLNRFRPRDPLPSRPRRALAISNYLEPRHIHILRAACERHGIELDAVGAKIGGVCEAPERLLPGYDLVFAKGRCAWEALAVGAAVIVCDACGAGPLVTSEQLDALRMANFGRRFLQRPIEAQLVAEQIGRYQADNAALVTREIRETAGLDQSVERLLACYRRVIAATGQRAADLAGDMRAAAEFLRKWPGFLARSSPAPAVNRRPTEIAIRQVVRDELRRERRERGMRRWWRSIQKRLPQIPWRSARS